MWTHKLGIKRIAANGKVEIRVQSDGLDLRATTHRLKP
jgi:uncharacterized protein (DUF2345 family)